MTNEIIVMFIIVMVIALPFAIPVFILKLCNNSKSSSDNFEKRIPPVPDVLPTPPMPTYDEFIKQHNLPAEPKRVPEKKVSTLLETANTEENVNDIIVEKVTPVEDTSVNTNNSEAPVSENNTPAHKEKKLDMTVSNILFLIGTAFVVLSGIAFGVASWVRTSHEGKVGIIAAAAIIAFMLSCVFKKAFKLSGSSISFYILGSGFTSTAFITAGYYELMGKWLSFNGDGIFMLLSTSLAITSVLMFIGTKIFDKLPLIYTALSTASLSLLFAVFQIFDTIETAAPILMTLQALITLMTFRPNTIKNKKYDLPIKRISLTTAVIYGLTGISYIVSTICSPTASSYICIAVVMAQLIFYGYISQKNIFVSVESIFSIILAVMTAFSVTETLPTRYFILVFSTGTVISYLFHRFVPVLNNVFTETITLIFSVILGFAALVNAYDCHFIPELIIGAVISAIIFSYVFSKNDNISFTAGILAPIFPITMANIACYCIRETYHIENTTALDTICWSIAALLFIIVTAILIFMPNSKFNQGNMRDSILHLNMISSGIIFIMITEFNIFAIIPLLLCIIHFALSNKFKYNYASLLSSIAFIRIITDAAKMASCATGYTFVSYLILLSVIIVYITASKFIFSEAIFSSKNGKYTFDPLFLTAWLMIPSMFGSTRISAFFILIAIAAYCAGFIRKNTNYETASVFLTASTFFTALALIIRPFFIPEYAEVSNKITIGIIALSGFICRIVWRKYKENAKVAANIIYILSFISLLFDAMYFDTAANTIFVMSVMVFALVVSIMTRSKTWFTTSASSLFVITVFATREYLTALNWWVYLFITGMLLIALAVINEYCKKNNETIKSSVAKKFSGWNW